MLETIREFALERLHNSGVEDDLRRRHARRMLEIARAAHLATGDVELDVEVVLTEREDLRAALDWAEANDANFGLELAVSIQNLWIASGPKEGMDRIERLFDRAGGIPTKLRAKALRAYAATSDMSGHDQQAEQLLRESQRLYEELGDEEGIATVEHMLAVSAWRREDWERMRELTEHSLDLARGRFGHLETSNYWLLGQLALADGDLQQAIELTRRSADLARESGWAWWESGQRHELLMLSLRRGDLDEAEREGVAALEMERGQENRRWALYTFAGLAQVALGRGDLERAGLLWGAAEKEAESLPRWADERARRGGALLEEHREGFASAQDRGRALELWDAVAVALGE